MTLRFDGQVALITGGGRGLGAAYAHQLARLGAHVVVHDAGVAADGSGEDDTVAAGVADAITSAGGKAVPAGGNLLAPGVCERLVCDTIDRLGRLDVLVHNAGVVMWEEPGGPTDEQWDQTMGVNAVAALRLLRSALPHFRRQGYGRVVLTVSGRATRVANAAPGLVAYSAAKMAVYGLMVGFAAELQDVDVTVNAVSPVAATRMLVRDAPELTPDAVAPAVAVLASPYVTTSGSVLAAAGGHFRLDTWQEGREIDLGPAGGPDELLRVWPDLLGGADGSRRPHA